MRYAATKLADMKTVPAGAVSDAAKPKHIGKLDANFRKLFISRSIWMIGAIRYDNNG